MLGDEFLNAPVAVYGGATWTTDAPFRETETAIAHCQDLGIMAVEMEAAALYAFAEARHKAVVCFAHVTNQMAQAEGDFEKGADGGSQDALQVMTLATHAWRSNQAGGRGAIHQMERELRAERAAAGRASAKARGKTGGRPRTDAAKLENARILYENSGKTAAEVCEMVGVGRRTFFAYLARQREGGTRPERPLSRSLLEETELV